MAPKYKSSDAGNLDLPKRNCKMFPLSEKVKVVFISQYIVIPVLLLVRVVNFLLCLIYKLNFTIGMHV
jgi:hypothetical protein